MYPPPNPMFCSSERHWTHPHLEMPICSPHLHVIFISETGPTHIYQCPQTPCSVQQRVSMPPNPMFGSAEGHLTHPFMPPNNMFCSAEESHTHLSMPPTPERSPRLTMFSNSIQYFKCTRPTSNGQPLLAMTI